MKIEAIYLSDDKGYPTKDIIGISIDGLELFVDGFETGNYPDEYDHRVGNVAATNKLINNFLKSLEEK